MPRHVTVDGQAFELQQVVRDGVPSWLLVCPRCGKRGLIDDDQLHGRVSIVCGIDGCQFHETHDFAAAMDSST